MSVLRSIESKIEGLFEGVFGRAFRTHVQPIELARWLAKEMDLHRSVSVSRVYVPNEYTVYLSPADRAQFASYEGSLIGELQEYLAEHARREGYALLTPPKVLLATDPDLAMGESGVAARVVQPEEGLAPIPTPRPGPQPPPTAPAPAPSAPPLSADADASATVVYRREPAAAREVVTLTLGDRSYPVASGTVVIGRSRECDIRVGDANVSRRHAEVREDGDSYWLVDLGSTNGTQLNGRRVDRAKLSDGDTITLGSTTLRFGRSTP
jgi:pSer/pThr/pTyr-binding forkhead associated (FHA) protein